MYQTLYGIYSFLGFVETMFFLFEIEVFLDFFGNKINLLVLGLVFRVFT
jgi:hypothetical protein